MIIVGFSQLRNEKEKGNLENWFRCMNELCDYIYIFDQNSTDGSQEFYKTQKKARVLYSKTNRFSEERICKQELLEKIKKECPNADWVFWMDGDTLIDGRLLGDGGKTLRCVLSEKPKDIGLCTMGHYNLWRSSVFYRVDSKFHNLHRAGVKSFWRFKMDLFFNARAGLHGGQVPKNVGQSYRLNYSLVHMGFSTDYQILNKYSIYKERGQNGWALERLIDEKTLSIEKIPDGILPIWFKPSESEIINPKEKIPIFEIWNDSQKG